MGVVLKIVEGYIAEKEFKFEEPDIFLFGRAEDCQCCLPDDKFVSRHHFILEVNPPERQVKDLESLNGTWINGIKYGGRDKGEPADVEEALKDAVPLELKNGDIIKVGNTRMKVVIDAGNEKGLPANCVKCSREIPPEEKEELTYVGGTYLCRICRQKVSSPKSPPKVEYQKPASVKHQDNKIRKVGDKMLEELLGALFGQAVDGGAQMPRIQGCEFMRELGVGGFGKVYLVKRESDGKELALKVMVSRKREVTGKEIEYFKREMDNCLKLSHPNIVKFEESGYTNGLFYFTMEYCAGGSRCICRHLPVYA